MDQDLYGIEIFLDKYDLIEQAIDYCSIDLNEISKNNNYTFEFEVDWELPYCCSYTVIYMPFKQYVKEYGRHINFRVRQ